MVKKNDNWFVSLVKQRRIWSVFCEYGGCGWFSVGLSCDS